MFLASFYLYLNYDADKEFVVDFEFVWKWCGFTRKSDAKRVLEKNFIIDIDFTLKNIATMDSVDNRGGHNKENIYLTVNAFKKFCLKAGTKHADNIHNYYIKLENLIQQTLDEETMELREQLVKKDKALMVKIEEFNKLQENHKRILYKRNKQNLMKGSCFYIIRSVDIENRFKFGITRDLNSRQSAYRTYAIDQFLYITYT